MPESSNPNPTIPPHALENGPVVFYRADAGEEYRITHVSPSVSRFGFSPERLVGEDEDSYVNIIHPDDRFRCRGVIRLACGRGDAELAMEYRIIDAEGRVRWVEDRIAIERDGDGNPAALHGFVIEITDRKRAGEQLRAYRHAVESTDRLVAAVDREGRYLFVNRAFCDYNRVDADEMRGRHASEVLGEEAFENHVKPHLDRCLAGESVKFEMTRGYPGRGERHIEVAYFPLRDGGRIVGVLSIITDITERRRSELAREESERRLRSFAENFPDGALLIVDRAMNYLFCDGRGLRSVGLSPDDFTGKNVRDFFPPETFAVIEENVSRVFETGGDESYELEYAGRVYDNRAVAVKRDAAGTVTEVLVVSREITGRRIWEEELRFQASILDSISDVVTATDMEGRVMYVNEAACRALGKTRDELIGGHVGAFGEDPAEGAVQREIVERTRADGEWRGEVVNIAADGSRILLDVRTSVLPDAGGNPSGMVGISTDITGRRQAEKALRESEERFRSVFETSPVGIALVDTVTQRFLRANPAFLDIVGYTADELLERTVEDITHPGDWESERPRIDRALDDGLPFDPLEKRYIRKDGAVRWVRVTGGTMVLPEETNPVAVAGVEDVTERRRAEEQFLQAQKMESVGRLAGGIAHDFNNLLTVIGGTSELALMDLKEGDRFHDDFLEIRRTADRASRLTRQLLAFSRKEIASPRVVGLNRLLMDMEAMLRRIVSEDIEIVFIPGQDLWQIKVDPGQMEQLLTNLVVNACDAMPEGGTLTIETQNVVFDRDYTNAHLGAKEGEHVMMAVSDTGAGMDEETLGRIFEPFFTTKTRGRGTGLGLSTCYGIVKQNGGVIWAYSEPGEGSSFKIYLPRTREEGPAVTAHSDAETAGGDETILVVEDETSVRAMIGRILGGLGYRVVSAIHGEEAVQKYDELGGAVDLVLTDVIMPRMGGRELAGTLTARDPALRVIYMSGYTDNSIVHHGMLDPGVTFIQKPFTPRVLAIAVRKMLDGE